MATRPSPGVKIVPSNFDPESYNYYASPYWLDEYILPATPEEIDDWATKIFNAANFLNIFEEE